MRGRRSSAKIYLSINNFQSILTSVGTEKVLKSVHDDQTKGRQGQKGGTSGRKEGKAAMRVGEKRVTDVSHEPAAESLPAANRLLGTCPLAREIFVPKINGIAFFWLNRDSYTLRPTSARMTDGWLVNIGPKHLGFHISCSLSANALHPRGYRRYHDHLWI